MGITKKKKSFKTIKYAVNEFFIQSIVIVSQIVILVKPSRIINTKFLNTYHQQKYLATFRINIEL